MTISADSDISDKRVWTTLITNTKYLTGLIALDYSLKRSGSKYPLVALYTETFEEEGHRALDLRKIPKIKIPYLLPTSHKDYSNDVRFYDCWSKLTPFKLVQFDKIVQLDSDMIVLHNMDELMDLELNDCDRIFAATHACVCNPYKKTHYPKDWVEANCAYTSYHENKKHLKPSQRANHVLGPPGDIGLSICNGGLQIVKPNLDHYNKILSAIDSPSKVSNYDFADQSLLSDVFNRQWVSISYKYNALKTLSKFHSDIWDIEEVKNIHYILSPKPWDIARDDRGYVDDTETFKFWWDINDERLLEEKTKGVVDGF